MNTFISRLVRWQPSRDTLAAIAAGMVIVILSAVMLPFRGLSWVNIAIRDIGQIFVVGILFPLTYIKRSGRDWAEFGLSLKKWQIFLPINFVLGVLLLLLFLSDSPPSEDFSISSICIWTAIFVMLALFFELIFFYSFLRTMLEKAFGIVPAIIITSLFYAFHHIGFQPEYGKLIFVGLLYAMIYRIGNSALLIFPFFLGVGGLYDVFVQSQAVSPVLYPKVRTLYLAAVVLVTVVWSWRNPWRKG